MNFLYIRFSGLWGLLYCTYRLIANIRIWRFWEKDISLSIRNNISSIALLIVTVRNWLIQWFHIFYIGIKNYSFIIGLVGSCILCKSLKICLMKNFTLFCHPQHWGCYFCIVSHWWSSWHVLSRFRRFIVLNRLGVRTGRFYLQNPYYNVLFRFMIFFVLSNLRVLSGHFYLNNIFSGTVFIGVFRNWTKIASITFNLLLFFGFVFFLWGRNTSWTA